MAYGSTSYGGGSGGFQFTLVVRTASDSVTTPTETAARANYTLNRNGFERLGPTTPRYQGLIRPLHHAVFLERPDPASDIPTKGFLAARSTANVVTVTDANSRAGSRYFRLAADSAPAVDGAVRVLLPLARSAADALAAISDTAIRVAVPFKRGPPADNAPATDSAVRSISLLRSATDSTTTTDAATRLVFRARTATDSTTTTDSATRFSANFRAAADTVTTPNDGQATWIRLTVVVSGADSAPATDALTTLRTAVRTAADIAPATDAATRFSTRSRSASDTTSTADVAVRTSLFLRTGSEAAPANDAGARYSARYRTAIEQMGFGEGGFGQGGFGGGGFIPTDAATRLQVLGRTPADLAPVSDVVGRFSLWIRAAADTVTPGDAASRYSFRVRTTAEALAAPTDVATRFSSRVRTTPDATTTTDVVTRGIVLYRTGSEAAPATDAGIRLGSRFRTATDVVTPAEVATRLQVLGRALLDGAPASDTVASSTLHFRTAIDSVTPAEVATRSAGVFSRAMPDSAPTADAFVRLISLYRSARDLAAQEDTRSYGGLVQKPFHAVWSSTGGGFIGDYASGQLVSGRSASDATTTSDSATRAQGIGRTPSDTTTTSDSATRFTSRSRVAGDSTATTDGATAFVFRSRTAADSTSTTDAVVRALAPARRSAADSAPASDADVGARSFFRTTADVVTPTDSAVRQTTYLRSASDTTVTSDAASRFASRSRTAADSTTTVDVTQRGVVFSRTASDTVVTTDAAVRQVTEYRSVQDQAGSGRAATGSLVSPVINPVFSSGGGIEVYDAASTFVLRGRVATDTAPAADVVLRTTVYRRTTANAAPASDALGTPHFALRTAADTAPASDSVVRTVVYRRSLAEAVTASDTQANQTTLFRSAYEGFGFGEGGFGAGGFGGTSIAPADSALRYVQYVHGAADSTTTTDSAQRRAVYQRTPTDSTTTTDVATRFAFRPRTTTDTITPTDGAARTTVYKRALADTAPASDVGVQNAPRFRTASDVVTPTDTAARSGIFGRTPADSTATSDSTSRFASRSRTATDSTITTDGAARAVVLGRNGVDVAGTPAYRPTSLVGDPFQAVFATAPTALLIDGAERVILPARVAADAAPASDGAVRGQGRFFRAVAETTSVVDVASKGGYPFRTGTDSAPASDAVTRTAGLFVRNAADTTTTSDAVGRVKIAIRPTTETLTIGDAATRQPSFARSVSDSAPASDAGTRYGSRFRTTADVVTPTDAATRSTIYIRSASDATTTADAATRFASRTRSSNDTGPFVAGDSATRSLYVPRGVQDDTTWPVVPPTGLVQPVVRPLTISGTPSRPYDSARGNIVAGRLGAETAPAVDTATRFVFRGRVGADAAPAAETAARTVTYWRWVRDQANYVPSSSTGLVQPIVHTVLPYNQGDANDDVGRWVANYRRTGDDALLVTETLTTQTWHFRTTSDSAPATDALTSLATHFRATADSVSAVTDSVARLAVHPRTTTDVAPAADALTSLTSHFRTAADSAPAVDSLTSLTTHYRVSADAAPSVDALVRFSARSRTVSDTAPASDALVSPSQRSRATSDSAPASDALASLAKHFRTTSDAAPATDADVRQTSFARSGADSIAGLTDAVARQVVYRRALADSAPALDFIGHIPPAHPTDNAPATDSVTRSGIFGRQVAEPIPGRQPVTRGLVQPVVHALAPVAPTADVATRSIIYVRSAADAAPVVDATLSTTLHPRTAADGAPATDTLSQRGTYQRGVRDEANYVAQVTRGLVQPLVHPVSEFAVGDSNDDAARWVALYRRLSGDTTTSTDSATRYVFRTRTASDTAPATEAVISVALHFRLAIDTAPAADTLLSPRLVKRTTTDTAPASDALVSFTSHYRSATDAAPAVQTQSSLTTHPRSVTDTAPASDQDVRQTFFARTTTETVTVTDALARSGVFKRALTETVTATDSVRHVPPAHANDSAPAADSVARFQVLARTVAETPISIPRRTTGLVQPLVHPVGANEPYFVTTDGVSRVQNLFRRTGDDGVFGSDTVASPALHFRTTSDVAPATDLVTRQVVYVRGIRDEGNFLRPVTRGLVQSIVHPVAAFAEGDANDDAARWVALYRRLTGDTTTAADALVSQAWHYRSATDTAPATDSIATLTRHFRVTSDTAPANDAGLGPAFHYRTAADVVTPTDAASRSQGVFRRTTADAVTASDAVRHQPPQHVTDTAPAVDSVSRSGIFRRAVSETPISIPRRTSGLVQPIVHPVPADEPYLVTTDDVARLQNLFRRTGDDGVLASESVTSWVLHFRTASDTTTPVAESVARKVNYRRSIRDEGNFLQPVTKGLVQPLVHPLANFAEGDSNDDVARWVALYRRLSDDVALANESVASFSRHFRTTADTVTSSDANTHLTTHYRVTSDAAPASDAGIGPAFLYRSAGDLAPVLSDVATRSQGIFRRTASDAVTAADAVRHQPPVHVSDSAPAADSVTRSGIFRRNTAETPISVPRRTSGLVQPIVHPVPADAPYFVTADDATRIQNLFRRLGDDGVLGSEAVTSWTLHFRNASDSAPSTEGVVRKVNYRRGVRDEGNYLQPVTRGLVQPIVHPVAIFAEGDSNDDVARWVALYRRLTDDAVLASESVSSFAKHFRVTADTVTPVESNTHLTLHFRAVSDAAPASDAGIGPAFLYRTTSDLLVPVPSDTAVRSQGIFRRLAADSVTASDAVRHQPPVHVSDSAPAADSVVRSGVFRRNTTETPVPIPKRVPGLVQPVVHPVPADEPYFVTVDDVTRIQNLFRRTGDDGVLGSESVTSWVLHVRAVSEVAPASDAVARKVNYRRFVRDEGNFLQPVSRGLVQPLVHPVSNFAEGDSNDDVARWVALYRRLSDDTAVANEAVLRRQWLARAQSDTAPVLDAARAIPPVHINDAAPASDSAVRQVIYRRAISETPISVPKRGTGLVQPIVHPVPADEPYFVTTDDLARLANYFRRTGDDGVFGSDSVASWVLHFRAATDSAPSTEAVTRRVYYFRLLRDEGNFLKPVTGGLVQPIVHPVSDLSVGDGNDDVTRFVRYFRRLADDAVLANESVASYVLHVRAITETVTSSDANAHLTKHIRSLADAAPATDQDVRQTYFARSTADVVTPTDSASRGLTLWKRSAADSVPVADNASAVPPGRASDSAPATDSVTRTGIFRRTASDAVTPSDTATRLAVRARTTADSAPLADAAVRSIILLRAATDSTSIADTASAKRSAFRAIADAAPASDVLARTSSYLRALYESIPTTDVAARDQGLFSRATTDSAPAVDSLRRVSTLMALCVHVLPVPTDVALDRLSATRLGTDAASATDLASQHRLLSKIASDTAPAADSVSRVDYLFRANVRGPSFISDYYDPPLDRATRTGLFFRAAIDTAVTSDQGLPPAPIHIRALTEVLPPVSDSLVSHVLAKRAASDFAPAQDNTEAARHLDARRSVADVVTPTDTPTRSRTRAVTSSDGTTTGDAVTRFFSGKRAGSDGASVTEIAARLLSARRTANDSTTTADGTSQVNRHLRALFDLLPAANDGAVRKVAKARTARDLVLIPVDAGWWLQSHRVAFGPPVADITSISKTKIGNEPGCDTVEITFTFDRPVDAWAVRINSTGPFDGNLAAAWTGPGSGSTLRSASATISASLLLHGENDVMVYGRSLDGVWSFPESGPVADLAGAR